MLLENRHMIIKEIVVVADSSTDGTREKPSILEFEIDKIREADLTMRGYLHLIELSPG